MPKSSAPIDVTCTLFLGVRPRVQTSQVSTWADFVAADLPEMLAQECPEKRRLPGFVLAHVEGTRTDANTGAHTALAIDVDAIPNNDLGWLQKRAKRFTCALYETASSTDAAPRVRVIAALAEPIAPEHVPGARRELAEALSLDPDACGTAGALPTSQVMFCGRLRGTRERGLWVYDGDVWAPQRTHTPKAKLPRSNERRASAALERKSAFPDRDSETFRFDLPPDLSAIAKHVPPPGVDGDRHLLVRALGGWLARRGYEPRAIADAVREQIPSDCPVERAAQAQDAAERARAGEDAPGWQTLSAWVERFASAPRKTLRRLGAACRDPREPEGYGDIWSEQAARDWAIAEAHWRRRDQHARGKASGRVRSERASAAQAERRAGNEAALRAVAPDLVGAFECDADGKPYSHASNVELAVRHYMGHAVARNAATGRPMIVEHVTLCTPSGVDAVFAPGLWEDMHTTRLHAAVCRLRMSRPSRNDTDAALRALAAERDVWPIRSYLEALPAWDGVARTLCTYLGVERTEYAEWVCGAWMRSCVARGMVPGCQVDHVLVLEGSQGSAKSSALRVLAGDGGFGEFTARPGEPQKVGEQLQGKWIVEISELDKWTRTYSSEEMKSMLTRRDDEYRTPYDKYPAPHPRTAVYSGTTNYGLLRGYLTDDSGNRRYWPIVTTEIDLAALASDREQLWAQALAEYRAGGEWWPHTPELKDMVRAEQERRMVGDAWERAIARWVRDQDRAFTSAAAAQGAVGLELERVDARVVARIERCLLACACVRTENRRGERVWRRGE